MKRIISTVLLAAATLTAGAASANELDRLLEQVKKDRISEAKIDKQREAEFLSARADKQALLRKAKKELGWQPKILFEDGLDKTITWYREILRT